MFLTEKAVKCLCKAFKGEAVTSLIFMGSSQNLLAASGKSIHQFDLRNPSILQTESKESLEDAAMDEINQLALHTKSGRFVAAADDSGDVRVFDFQAKPPKLFKVLAKAHTNLCTAVKFRPRVPWELVSGAFDSSMAFW